METKKVVLAMSKVFFAVIIMIGLFSCEPPQKEVKTIDFHSMTDILNNCKGHAVVTAKGFYSGNSGNFESYKYSLIIRDDSMNCFEYVGGKYDVAVGDTLK